MTFPESENPEPLPSPAPLRERSPWLGYRHLLTQVRAAQHRSLWIQGALAALASSLLLLCLAAGAAQLSLPLAKGVLFAIPVVGFSIAGFLGVFLARRQVGNEEKTARLIGARIPGVSLDLLAAVELEQALKQAPNFSPGLAEAFLERTNARAREISVHAVIDPRPVHHAWGALGGAVALFVIISVVTPRGFWKELGRRAVVAGPPVAEVREPITGEIELTYHYPAYTGLAPRTVESSNGDVTAPVGTEVVLKTRADRDVRRAEVLLKAGTQEAALPLTVTGTRELHGSFIVKATGTYTFLFRDSRGREVARGPALPLVAEADAAPRVTLLLPAAELEVDPAQAVTLKYEAQDDYGLTELSLVYRVAGKDEGRLPLWQDAARRFNGQHTWQLAPLKLAAGDRVSYFIEARDNAQSSGGAQKGASRTQSLRVYSASAHRREQLQRVEQLWERLIKQLADRMEGPDRQVPADLKKMIAQGPLDDAGAELVKDLYATARLMQKERERPQALIAGLLNIRDGYDKALKRTLGARSIVVRFGGTRGTDFTARVAHVVGEEIAELERDVLYLESLLDRQRMDELKDLSKKLAQDRRELTRLVEQFQKSKDDTLKDAIMKQAEAVKRDIQQLMQRMAELGKGMRDEHINLEALAEQAKQQSMTSDLDAVEKALREGKTEEALKKLADLANKVDQMQQGLDRAQKGQGKSNPELVKKFREFAQELKTTADAQRRVAASTKDIRDRYKERMRARLKERGGALKEQLKKDVEALQKDYHAVELKDVGNRADEPKQRVNEELDNLHNALNVEDFDLAAESADRGDRAAQELAQFGEHQQRIDEYYQNPANVQGESKKTAEQLAADAQKVHEIAKKLADLFPAPSSMLSEADKEAMKQLQGQQHGLNQKAQGLKQKMQDINQLAPVFGDDGQQKMDSVGERMGEAEQRLQGRDPGRGYGEQKAALEGLEQLQQQMQQQGQSGGGSGGSLPLPMMAGSGGQEEGGDDVSHERVEIPDSDQFKAPKEFRQDLMDAMKQGTPEKYKDQVKRYYEELVK